MNHNYTELLNQTLSSFQEDYDIFGNCSESDLLDYLNENFHPFSDGIANFIRKYIPSFTGDISKPHDIYTFVANKYKELEYDISEKTIHNWFFKNAFPAYTSKGRRSMYALCFAFGFNIELTKQFFQKVYLDRCFDCRNMEEAVYFYCLNNSLTYAHAVSIIEKCPDLSVNIPTAGTNILYTNQIQNKIEHINSEEELLEYFNNNIYQFQNTKLSAYRVYKDLLDNIAVPRDQKKEVLKLIKNNEYPSIKYLSVLDWYNKESFAIDNNDKRYDILKSSDISSSAFVMKQIFNFEMRELYESKDPNKRYYNNLISNKNTSKLPDIVRQNFPSQHKLYLEKNWEKVSYDTIRKLIILLYFYEFCVKCQTEWHDLHKLSSDDYFEYFIHQMNNRLYSAGFEDLYIGNPYDWIFIFSSKTQSPLDTFRSIYHCAIFEEYDEEW